MNLLKWQWNVFGKFYWKILGLVITNNLKGFTEIGFLLIKLDYFTRSTQGPGNMLRTIDLGLIEWLHWSSIWLTYSARCAVLLNRSANVSSLSPSISKQRCRLLCLLLKSSWCIVSPLIIYSAINYFLLIEIPIWNVMHSSMNECLVESYCRDFTYYISPS